MRMHGASTVRSKEEWFVIHQQSSASVSGQFTGHAQEPRLLALMRHLRYHQ